MAGDNNIRRNRILAALRNNQPPAVNAPALAFQSADDNLSGQQQIQRYHDMLVSVGGDLSYVDSYEAMIEIIEGRFDTHKRIVTTVPALADRFEAVSDEVVPHSYEDVELAIMQAHFAVAENGAVWITDKLPGQRIVPFICQHLAIVVDASAIVSSMHDAYRKIGSSDYGYGVFIAGPSKTADIEQSLVLGAHGPMSMTVFLLNSKA